MTVSQIEPLLELDGFGDLPEFGRLRRALGGKRERVRAGGLWGASQAHLLAALSEEHKAPWYCIAATEAEAATFARDLEMFGREVLLLPTREGGGRGSQLDFDSVRRRLQAAQTILADVDRERIVVASLLSTLQPLPSPSSLGDDFLNLQVNQRLDTEALLVRLTQAGFTRLPLAERPGEISLRGDIFDIFPFAADTPLRVELFGEEIESLRSYDSDTQLSTATHKQLAVCVASDAGGVEDGRGTAPAQLMPSSTVFVEVEPLRVDEQAEGLRIRSTSHGRALGELRETAAQRAGLSLQSLPTGAIDFDVRSVQGLAVGIHQAPEELEKRVAEGEQVTVLCNTTSERDRFAGILAERPSLESVELALGSLSRGYRLAHSQHSFLNHRELVGMVGAGVQRKGKATHKSRVLKSFFELRRGDLVVHAVHGLGRFLGLTQVERGGGQEDHLHLEFADAVSLYVPVSRIDLVQRYVGSGSAAPKLDKLGGQSFRKRKEKVERALQDLAAELLEVQATRELRKREAWSVDRPLVDQLAASFPYDETEDQLTVDREIDEDLTSGSPMDRLLCGDVGFGKTEIAIRAAFRVVSGGGQVALLVPTTVLAQQHFRTLSERLAAFPVSVEVLDRYVKGKALKALLNRIANGQVDILVGTHRILSDDVPFPNLGLVVIDEEQRFGVVHKEHFKSMRATIDVLTLSATPIPRTLHMSLAGVRDISALTVPPSGRQDIETRLVVGDDNAVIREALLSEKNRGGQVFFLHNKVHSIEQRARELRALVPECSFAIGHGQMPGRALNLVMESFIRGEADVLVATTIIENGIDIPSAGTIIVDRADTFGLSELHQLRGRVGRGGNQGHCLLLVDPNRPLPLAAKERLKALEELHQLGAGFQISMKDLEIRGAGNILGPEQSGHIGAVGYDMYCRLLKSTIETMQGAAVGESEHGGGANPGAVEMELGLEAYLPKTWIPAESDRLELLRSMDSIRTDADADGVRARARDRFGRLPESAETLLEQFRLRTHLARAGITLLAWRTETYLIQYQDRVLLEGAMAASGQAIPELRPLKAGQAHLVIPPDRRTPRGALEWIWDLLKPAPSTAKMS